MGGGTFSNVWEAYEAEQKKEADNLVIEQSKITKAIEKIAPTRMRNLMLIEIWNDRFYGDEQCTISAWSDEHQVRPQKAEFMGVAVCPLDLENGEWRATPTLPLKSDYGIVKREITGDVIVDCHWDPN